MRAVFIAAFVSIAAVSARKEGEDIVVRPSPDTVHFGGWSAEYPAVAVANSGDVVHLWTVSGEPGGIPLDDWAVPHELQSIWQKQCGKNDGTQPGCLDRTHCPVPHCGAPGPHIMTGPVRVKGAEPGDILKVEILTTEPWSSWGWNTIRKGKGALGHLPEFDVPETVVIPIDVDKKTARMPWGGAETGAEGADTAVRDEGVEFPLNCFFGQMGVAPAPNKGTLSSIKPGEHGGNLDNKDLSPGSTLYFRVNVPGAMFSAGDGHGAQGDGEFCVTALETSLHGRFRLTVLKNDDAYTDTHIGSSNRKHGTGGSLLDSVERSLFASHLANPRAETDTHYVSMAFHESLDVAEKEALLDMIRWLHELTGVKTTDLYRTASLVADMRVTQVVNVKKGIHLKFPKAVAEGLRTGSPYETRYPAKKPTEPNEEMTEFINGIDPKIFEGVDAAKVFAEIEAEKTRVSAQIESVTAEIAEIASLLEQAEIAAQEMEAEMSRQRFEQSGEDHLDSACDQCDLSDEAAAKIIEEQLARGLKFEDKFSDENPELVSQLREIQRKVYEEAVAFMEDEATDEEKELGAAWTRENILDPLHEEYERYAQAQREAEAKEDPGSNPGWGENEDDEDEEDEVVFSQEKPDEDELKSSATAAAAAERLRRRMEVEETREERRRAEAEAERLEAERLERLEAERLEAERLEEAERLRILEEESESARLDAEAAELARLKAETEERDRLARLAQQEEEDRVARIKEEEEAELLRVQRMKREAEQAEQARLAAEEERRRALAEEEAAEARRRREAAKAEERQRVAEEKEAIRILEEEDDKRLKLEADRRARAAAEESRRLEAERVKRLEEIEERRKLQEAERQKEKEAQLAKERARKAAEAEAARLEQEKAEAAAMETRRVEEEARRRAAALEEEEAGRKKQLEEAKLAAEKAHLETEAAKRREEEANAEMALIREAQERSAEAARRSLAEAEAAEAEAIERLNAAEADSVKADSVVEKESPSSGKSEGKSAEKSLGEEKPEKFARTPQTPQTPPKRRKGFGRPNKRPARPAPPPNTQRGGEL